MTKGRTVILSHYATTGACEELRDWLVAGKAPEVVYIAFPFGHNPDRHIRVERYRDGVPGRARRSWFGLKLPEPLAYCRDFLYALLYLGRYAVGADLVVAGDNLLSTAGLVMRRLIGIRRVVYYMIDYSPIRYKNRLLNAIYYAVDRFAAQHANVVWPLSEAMIRARFEAGRLDARRVNWYVVPYGSHPIPQGDYDRRHVVYMGDILSSKGAELLVPMALELRRRVPGFRLRVIGGGRDLAALRAEVTREGLEACVEICGFVRNMEEVIRKIAVCGVAVAPYCPHDAGSFTFFADPGKIKVYLGCGLPIVLTAVPPVAQLLESRGAGSIAAYDAAALASAVAEMIESDGYARRREAARLMGAEFAWPRVLTEAFKKLDDL